MQIFVNLPSQETLTLDAVSSDTVADVKSSIQSQRGTLVDGGDCHLIHGGKLLEDDSLTLAHYGIKCQFATIQFLPRLRGGGGNNKRKKKVFSTPKKEKKEKEKEKLSVLKLYRVVEEGNGDGDSSVVLQRLREECPKCGAGTFMADHGDRISCGKCGLSCAHQQMSIDGGDEAQAEAEEIANDCGH